MSGIGRLLWVPNEIGDGLQFGYRRAFADLVAMGAIEHVEVFSLEQRMRAGGDPAEHRAALLDQAARFKPDVVFVQHAGYTGLGAAQIDRLLAGGAALLYQEADPYTRWIHPLPRTARIMGNRAAVVFTCGAGTFSANFRRAGARRVEWMPHTFDPGRVDARPNTADRSFDVVVVANQGRARFRPLPSAGQRRRFVDLLQQRWGSQMGLYGNGWTGPAARGPVPYSEQSDAIRSGRISANWDHFAAEPCYFSDRLPISLASGSIHATTLHPGYGAFFPPSTSSFLITGATPEDLASRIAHHLDRTSSDQRLEAEDAARAYAWSTLRQDDHLVTMLNAIGADIDPHDAHEAWDLDRVPLSAA